jgi:hypothetical protein
MRDGNKCKLCGKILTGDEIHFDHIVSWSKGGETTLENLQVLCAKHNLAKGNVEYIEPIKQAKNDTEGRIEMTNICKVLLSRGQSNLANLINKSYLSISENWPSNISQDISISTDDFDFSLVSIIFKIYSPLKQYERIKLLEEKKNTDIKDAIFTAFKERIEQPEVYSFDIEHYVDFSLDES